MCKLRRKLILFDYMVEKLVEGQKSKSPSLDLTAHLQRFNLVRYMKLLYFVCLQSVKYNSQVEDTLFDVFDNFIALPKGPVEADVYSNRSILPRYVFNGVYLEKSGQDKRILEISYPTIAGQNLDETKMMEVLIKDQKLERYCKMIDQAVEELLLKEDSFPFEDTDKLIDLSHMNMWNNAKMYNNMRLSVNNIYDLRKEKSQFEAIMA